MEFGRKIINIEDFNYLLPDEKIAKYPLEERDNSKLLFYDGMTISDDNFNNIEKYINKNSLMLFNNSKVINARIIFQKSTGSNIEIFCLEPSSPKDYTSSFLQNKSCTWKALVGNNKKWKEDALEKIITINNDSFTLFAKRLSNNSKDFEIEFSWDNPRYSFSEILQTVGEIPIPPYLNRKSESSDKQKYQTVYCKFEGSVAAPTAGLHFTDKLLSKLKDKNISFDYVTLHVGAGTFQPVKNDNVKEHVMHFEKFIINKTSIKNIKEKLGNIIAVGTTTVRTLESLYQVAIQVYRNPEKADNSFQVLQFDYIKEENILQISTADLLENLLEWMTKNKFDSIETSTQIMIIPGYDFKIISSLITNFHQPKSTLLLLLSAYIGDKWKIVYEHAKKNNYRFLSYGDSCYFKLKK